ncbi:MAG: hypothetical protein A3I03_14105 [Candidatus Rokubacteria bacterium RIFCSPLOWO2_02_FULL_68_19]|nr:MAG: hypothetical protein A3I03_14105 [Candidatus Rokubacteria bacterium RIFCSPLOWO2_02_FULL_68_19]
MIGEHGGSLELPDDAAVGDDMLAQPEQVHVILEEDATVDRLDLARERVEERGLPRPVGADQQADPLLPLQDEVEVSQRQKPVERNAEAFHVE